MSEGRNKRLVNGLEDSRRGSHHTSRNSCADVWLGPTKLLLFSVQAQGHFMKELFSVHWKSWWISAGFCHSRWRVSKWILWTEKTIAIRSVYRGHFWYRHIPKSWYFWCCFLSLSRNRNIKITCPWHLHFRINAADKPLHLRDIIGLKRIYFTFNSKFDFSFEYLSLLCQQEIRGLDNLSREAMNI